MRDIPDILAKIAAYKVDEVANINATWIKTALRTAPAPRGFLKALQNGSQPALICEVKKASPSKGIIRENFDPIAIAKAYAAGGAACLSVLTDGPGFQGSKEIFSAVRDATDLPLLRKDFMIDPLQVREARAMGADAILIILAMTDDSISRNLIAEAEALGMDVLVETHDADELQRAIDLGAALIGINNRNLRTFETSLDTFDSLAPSVPAEALLVAESGIFTRQDIERLKRSGAQAYLIGESLMRQADVEAATRALRGAL
ncbi:indole-3-glycerol phosphate synthase [Algimonas arctica]|uniref:Indole-3-glycerol phosphate synthase n=1 Tax=Algimonas arctica TaxID=1479486 RepID=A0A8J3CRH1_9PROT|nr:indole-3-glycerol phosphate synthase TrpC [Algimonas arctica]GHA90680.1 indole-3-glycerol phosphate synthase [Algimonas arctica]